MAKGDLISRNELLKEFDPNGERLDPILVRSRIVQANGTSEQKIRNKAIEEAIETAAKAICIGCGYLDGHNCTYKGSNCGVSKPMLEKVVEVLEQMKGGK